MKTTCRLALAAALMAAVSLPALAAGTDPDTPASHRTVVKPSPDKTAGKHAAMTEKAGSHAPATVAAPSVPAPGQAPAAIGTN